MAVCGWACVEVCVEAASGLGPNLAVTYPMATMPKPRNFHLLAIIEHLIVEGAKFLAFLPFARVRKDS